MTKSVFAVAHSHWDHEWYFTQEDADMILIENLDYLIETLEENPEFPSYTFDGQSSVIDKYLKIRPENKKRIEKLIADRRLFVGPWYTQTDALLGKTESVIRNLLYGVKQTQALGHTMAIGYAPDIFGMHAYFPSIYKRFGLKWAIFQRGVYNDQVSSNLNFNWQAPNGEVIPANNIFFGYGPGKFLSADDAYIKTRLKPILDELSRRNQHTDNLLLPAGGDQVLINRHFPKTIAELNRLLPDYDIKLTDYETFMQATWQHHHFPKTIEGELVAGQKSRIHNTCRSTRYDIKNLNFQVEDLLLNELEPLCTIGSQFGIKFPQNWLDQIWRKVFESQAHNGIGASNSDDANHDIVVRLTSALRQIKDLINMVKRQLTVAISKQTQLEDIVVLFNTNIREEHYQRSIVLFTHHKDFTLKTMNDEPLAYSVLHQDELDGGKVIVVTAGGEQEKSVPPYYRTEILVEDIKLPAMGFTTLQVQDGVAGQCDHQSAIKAQVIENEFYKVSFDDDQHLRLQNKQTRQAIDDPFYFDDQADGGDSFDYSPISGDQAKLINEPVLIDVTKSARRQVMRLEFKAQLPASLNQTADARSEAVKDFVIKTTLVLDQGERHLKVEHDVDNHIKDHRVRVHWHTGVKNMSENYADQGFSLLTRKSTNPHEATWQTEGFVEKPKSIFVFESMSALSDDKSHFSLHSGMLKEYQPYPDTHTLALTLFRSNGLLGRDNLAWRPGRASGINNMVVPTPDGQMLQQMHFAYTVEFGLKSIDSQQAFKQSDAIYTKTDFYQNQSLNSYLNRIDRFQIPKLKADVPAHFSLLHSQNENLFFAALKQGWNGGIVLRLFNPTNDGQPINLKTSEAIQRIRVVDLKEDPVGEFKEGQLLAAKDYITLKFN